MKVTNNRAVNAWFSYRVNGVPKRVFIGAYKTITLTDLTDINQATSKNTIANFTGTAAGNNKTVVPNNRVDEVQKLGARDRKVNLTVDQQTARRFEIEFS